MGKSTSDMRNEVEVPRMSSLFRSIKAFFARDPGAGDLPAAAPTDVTLHVRGMY